MTETPAPVADAIRLIFEYDGDDVRLISQQPVDVAVTGFDAHADVRAGRYAEVRDADNRPLTRVPVRTGDTRSAEVFPENPGEPITRVDVDRPSGAFTVVVPAPAAARNIALIDIAAPAPGTAGARGAEPPGEGQDRSPDASDITEITSFAIEGRGGTQ
ncbi:hypothetical protein [Arthrobacter sp. H20]|uniref:hypothetical protein n=1 Tax=Arthrobacter sp. H20 TaxID=1267981 RepID=UPI0004B56120|nr:hypothetical protein [Arthrobacter sp. H20]